MFLGGLKIDAKRVPKKWRKLSPKGTPKVSQNHQNGLQKPSQKRVPKKHRKNDDFQHPHTPLDRALAAARARFSLFDKMCLWHPFGSHFGGVLGGQMEAKSIKKRFSKVSQNYYEKWSIFDRFWGPFGVENGAQNRSKINHFSSRGSRGSQGSILEGFWINFEAILRWFLEGFGMYINAQNPCV